MNYSFQIPKRVRVLVLGGGIHGTGCLHDLATRGWKDIFLVEKNTLASATSSASTKLVHGGLRYLQNPRNFPLVGSALKERYNLQHLAPDLVFPLEFYLPVLKHAGLPGPILKIGLSLYDFLAGKYKVGTNKKISLEEIKQNTPHLNMNDISSVYRYWDMKTNDYKLVHRVADSALHLGAGIREYCEAQSIIPTDDGWLVTLKDTKEDQTYEVSTKYLINATGPWSNRLLEKNNITPEYKAVNSKGVHLLFPDIGHRAAMFLQSPEDGRIFFVVPWEGSTLVGTTETEYPGDPDKLSCDESDINYLLEKYNFYLTRKFNQSDIIKTFVGLRWLPTSDNKSLGKISRESVISEIPSKGGMLFTIYGGKLTTYRLLSQNIGDRIVKHFKSFEESKTIDPNMWVHP